MFKLRTLAVCGILLSSIVQAQTPSWSVDPNRFQYSMTVNAVLELNCDELQHPSNLLAAFVGDSIRGLANTSTVVDGHYQTVMTVYSDVASGETISFRFYDQATDTIYEAVDSIAFQDNAIYGSPSNPFGIANNYAPSLLALSNNSLDEGKPVGTAIGNLSTIDKDFAQSHAYSLVNGFGDTDNALFSINSNQLLAGFVADYVSKKQYSIRLRSTDNKGCYLDSSISITINKLNQPPTAINLSSLELGENNSINAFVASLSAEDTDSNQSFTFSLVSGTGDNGNSSFNIDDNNLLASESFNYEVQSAYSIRLQVQDAASNSFVDIFEITINDVNDAPSDIIMSDSVVSELIPIGGEVTTLSTDDEDINEKFTYDLVSGAGSNDNNSFQLFGNSLVTSQSLDSKSKTSYKIRLRSTDASGAFIEKAFNIYLESGNEAPKISDHHFSLMENASPGTIVGSLLATDIDANDSLTFKIIDPQTGFLISSAGLLSSARSFDYENEAEVSFKVEVSDQLGATDTATIYVEILDQIEASLSTADYFSPNGDGKNDYWKISNVELYSNYSLHIFSANGELVLHKSSNYNNDWDGTINGEQLPEGVYYYVLKDTQGTGLVFKGTITLKR